MGKIPEGGPCKFMPNYTDETLANGIICPFSDCGKKCDKCGHNPIVAKERLMNGIKTRDGIHKCTEEDVRNLELKAWETSFFNRKNYSKIDSSQRKFYK